MKYLTIIMAFIMAGSIACDSEVKVINTDNETLLVAVPVGDVDYPETIQQGRRIQMKVRLGVGSPCFTYSHYDIEVEGNEVYVTIWAMKDFEGCNSTESEIRIPVYYEPDGPGGYFFHFWKSEGEYYSFAINVTE